MCGDSSPQTFEKTAVEQPPSLTFAPQLTTDKDENENSDMVMALQENSPVTKTHVQPESLNTVLLQNIQRSRTDQSLEEMPKSSRSRRSKNPYNSFGNTPTENHKNKIDHFGEIPMIPRKVVEVVQLDVVESYGRMMNDGTL